MAADRDVTEALRRVMMRGTEEPVRLRGPGSGGRPSGTPLQPHQGRVEGDRPVTSAQRFARLLLVRPGNLRGKDAALLRELANTCP